MNRWREKSKNNLFHNSVEKDNAELAAQEWRFTGYFIDHKRANETCELCETECLRYHYEIINQNNSNKLLVGSSCIERFDIAVFNDKGIQIFGKEKIKYLDDIIEKRKYEDALNHLRELWLVSDGEEKEEINAIAESFKYRKCFIPSHLFHAFYLMKKYSLEYDPALFKVYLRGKSNMDYVLNMSEYGRELILPSFSRSQLIKVNENLSVINEEIKVKQSLQVGIIHQNSNSLNAQQPPDYTRAEASKPKHAPQQLNLLNKPCIPDTIVCSVCGNKTSDWISYNPNICRGCFYMTPKK